MSDEHPKDSGPVGEDDTSPVEVVVKRASRFSREFLATVISLATTALGVVAALAWNTALTKAFERFGSFSAQLTAYFVYAVVVTFVAVIVIVLLGRVATRVGAAPVEFKYPMKPGHVAPK